MSGTNSAIKSDLYLSQHNPRWHKLRSDNKLLNLSVPHTLSSFPCCVIDSNIEQSFFKFALKFNFSFRILFCYVKILISPLWSDWHWPLPKIFRWTFWMVVTKNKYGFHRKLDPFILEPLLYNYFENHAILIAMSMARWIRPILFFQKC